MPINYHVLRFLCNPSVRPPTSCQVYKCSSKQIVWKKLFSCGCFMNVKWWLSGVSVASQQDPNTTSWGSPPTELVADFFLSPPPQKNCPSSYFLHQIPVGLDRQTVPARFRNRNRKRICSNSALHRVKSVSDVRNQYDTFFS